MTKVAEWGIPEIPGFPGMKRHVWLQVLSCLAFPESHFPVYAMETREEWREEDLHGRDAGAGKHLH